MFYRYSIGENYNAANCGLVDLKEFLDLAYMPLLVGNVFWLLFNIIWSWYYLFEIYYVWNNGRDDDESVLKLGGQVALRSDFRNNELSYFAKPRNT